MATKTNTARTNGRTGDLRADLETVRTRIGQVVTQLSAVEFATVPLGTALERVDEYLSRAREHCLAARQLDEFTFGNRRPQFRLLEPDPDPSDVEAVIVWTLGDQIRDRLRAGVTALYDDPVGTEPLSPEDRTARIEQLQAEKFDLEVEEERILIEAEGKGLNLHRRADADPAAITAAW